MYSSSQCSVGSRFINVSATHSTGIAIGRTTKLDLGPLMPTSDSVLRKCIFWPVPSLTDWGLRCRIDQRTSGTQPSTGRSRSVMRSTTNIDWKCPDTAEMPVTRSSIAVIGMAMEGLTYTTTTGWIFRHTTREMVLLNLPTVLQFAMEVGGLTGATGDVWRARKVTTGGGSRR